MTSIGSPEFAFEVSLCAFLESTRDGVVSRQLGSGITRPGGRILDIVVVTPGPAFEQRTALTPAAVPAAIHESPLGAGRYRPVHEVLDIRPERRQGLIEYAVDAGILEQRRVNGRQEIKLRTRYPTDWFGQLIAIENKPDLTTPGALDWQLQYDVSLGLADRVVVATETHVTRTHLDRIPDPVGVWEYDGDSVTVHRRGVRLSPGADGLELLDDHGDWTEFTVVTPDAKRRRRRRMAEQAYGKGWRTFDSVDCTHFTTTERHGASTIPYCTWAETVVNPSEACGIDCPGYTEEAAPAVDFDAERARRSGWRQDTENSRRQSGLDRFRRE